MKKRRRIEVVALGLASTLLLLAAAGAIIGGAAARFSAAVLGCQTRSLRV